MLLQRPAALLGRHAPALKRFVPPAQRKKAWSILFRTVPSAGRTAIFARWFRNAAAYCADQGSPLYGRLLTAAANDIEARGPCWTVVEAYESNGALPPAGTPLAFMAAVHRVVLEHPGSALGRHYPSTGGDPSLPGAEEALLELVAEHPDRVRELLQRPVQTNEVARSRALLGGFLLVAEATRLPLRVLEFGASAGLNLRWDRYRYEIGDAHWGDESSPVRLRDGFADGVPPLHLAADVAERRGCDISPIDPTSEEGQITLLSHVWADQADRVEVLRAAFDVAGRVGAPVDRADALSWVRAQLRERRPGVATVVYDTCMMEYLDPAVRAEIHGTIDAAGAAADDAAPLAWLHLGPSESGRDEELRLTTWPGGRQRTLAYLDPYARSVRWQAGGD